MKLANDIFVERACWNDKKTNNIVLPDKITENYRDKFDV